MEINMATSQTLFKWNNGRFINLIKCLQEFKSSTEFRNWDSNANKVKLYKSLRKESPVELYEDKQDAFGPALVSKNRYKDLDDVTEFDLKGEVKTEK